MEFLHSFLRRHFAGKPVVASQKWRLFSQASLFRKLPNVINIFFGLFVSASRRLPSFIWRCCWWIDYRWNLSQTVYPATCVGKCHERFHLPPIRKGKWSRNVSRNCIWDRYLRRAGQRLDDILLTVPDVFAWVKSAQFPSVSEVANAQLIGSFEVAFDTGSVLCRTALWDCFGGEFWPSFLRNLVSTNERAFPKQSHKVIRHKADPVSCSTYK